MSIKDDKVAVIDYEMGNLFSVKRACEQVGLIPFLTSDATAIMESTAVILPGVGAFGDAIDNLKRLDLIAPIRDFIATGRPFMGICLGLQLLMSESEEFGHHKGLGIIQGTVVKFLTTSKTEGRVVKVPQVGWNMIYRPPHVDEDSWKSSLFQGIKNNEYMYFVHSFYAKPEDPRMAFSYTNYEGTEYASSIRMRNIFACQFHPEKSGSVGIKIYKNFAEMIK